MTTRSESPFDRNGSRQITDERRAQYQLHGSENLLGVAHQVLGEWRLWRDVGLESEVGDPFDLAGRPTRTAVNNDPPNQGDPRVILYNDDDTVNQVRTNRIWDATGEVEGVVYLTIVGVILTTVDGIEATEFEIGIGREPGVYGPTTTVNDVEVLSPAGVNEGGIGIELFTPNYRELFWWRMCLGCLTWLQGVEDGKAEIVRGPATRDQLTIPALTLPPGRGEI